MYKVGDEIESDDYPGWRYRVTAVDKGQATFLILKGDPSWIGRKQVLPVDQIVGDWRVVGRSADAAWRRTVEAAGFKVVDA